MPLYLNNFTVKICFCLMYVYLSPLIAGLRGIGFASAIGGSIAVLYIVGDKLWNSRGQTLSSTPNWA